MTARGVDVHVSLVSTDNRELLRRCLASLPAACEGLDWAVTVIDNASTDGTAEMVAAEFPWARLLVNGRRLGFTANHNQVIGPVVAEDGSRYVLILNEDTECDPQSIAELVACGDANRRVGSAGAYVVGPDGLQQPSLQPFPTVARAT